MAKKKSKKNLPLESVTRDAIAASMRAEGFVVSKEVQTSYGKIDVLVKEYKPTGELVHHIVEVKRENGSHHLKHAIAQLLFYKKHYGSNTKLYFATSDTSPLSAEAKRVMSVNPDILYKVF
jgi:hypothetical protein